MKHIILYKDAVILVGNQDETYGKSVGNIHNTSTPTRIVGGGKMYVGNDVDFYTPQTAGIEFHPMVDRLVDEVIRNSDKLLEIGIAVVVKDRVRWSP